MCFVKSEKKANFFFNSPDVMIFGGMTTTTGFEKTTLVELISEFVDEIRNQIKSPVE